ncbi:MAG TPA: 1-deoxy-D-xylulose-5-phosphate synthase [Candidatus Cloacimonas sp.]|jgi:1-deoxy-D-xylulose-5-phosphate synthase|nr:1-deoxy-D-xylulose-5-phosphate synthase [Candidatus Cloacimonas sp.]HPH70991.1 1-deoxy-D-xylulose-5-phosphate synthase [Candidatus Cloacimonas sp.]HRQ99893.1 1-deoxy-D-xylulose-5-phosphate synthase [Candidatus Cloacimonas sp.]HRR50341.1 1-deoxy-D-xylulose-5-phosphate synthase [Candidatus Cloacimonas sp.]HRV10475.1 1-deoxy-D-xylulose-5-phosphate synthase [Candidatus Cloacimonas sp.]
MILENITDPNQIKSLTSSELKILAKEVRNRIVEVVSKTGGHLAPSLGTVDLTIALLYLFDPLVDRIVWDVGHQTYGWKILTGRNAQFDSLRQYKGLCGFTNRDESPYDAFTTGHSSTSISAALGIACGRDLNNEKGHCIAVIGDGALTGGISFEALNHGGHLQKDKFIVILNDNEMSISKNVGGLQKYMTRMLASKSYNVLKKQIWDLSLTLPSNIRRSFIYGAQKLEESMMNILVPNIIFEDLGYKYVGPIDGHDIDQLLRIIKRVKNYMVGPVLIHIVTQKGKGYAPAEKDAALFHGTGPFELKTGKQLSSGKQSWSDFMGSTLVNLAKKNPKIVAITAAMIAGTGLTKFEETFPDRFFDVGIAEQHSVTLAAGMATKGIKPFVAIYSTFMQRALDQVIHDVALPKLPVVFCIDRAGIVGEDGATHQGAFDLSFLNFIPNLIILTPSTAEELSAMLSWAADYQEGPVAIRYPRGAAIHSLEHQEPVQFDPFSVKIHSHEGKIALVACGDAIFIAEEVHKLLEKNNIQSKLVQLLSVKPLNEKALSDLASTCNYIFTFESNAVIGGMGARITQLLSTYPVKVINFGYPDSFIPHGKISELLDEIGFTPAKLYNKISQILNE